MHQRLDRELGGTETAAREADEIPGEKQFENDALAIAQDSIPCCRTLGNKKYRRARFSFCNQISPRSDTTSGRFQVEQVHQVGGETGQPRLALCAMLTWL